MSRVLLICEYPTLNGGEQSLLAILPLLIADGFTFEAIAPASGALARAFGELGIRVLPLEISDSPTGKLTQQQKREQIATAIAGTKTDLVHANSISMGRLLGPVTADLGIPSISHVRDIVRFSGQASIDLNRHSRLLAVSCATRQYHVSTGMRDDLTFVAYNGVNLARFRPRAPTGWLHAELGLPHNALLVGAVGQLILRKGHDVLVAAAESAVSQLPNVYYVVAGERFSQKNEAQRFEAKIRQRVTDGPLAGRFHFLGVRDNIPDLLPELTLLAHPARQEPLGRVLLEAGASGVPVVATDVGGTREIFGTDAAELVPPDDPQALARAIVKLASDAPLRQRLALAALSQIATRFSVQLAAATLAQHYREVLAVSAARAACVASVAPGR